MSTDLCEEDVVEEQLGLLLVLGDVGIVMHAENVGRGVDGKAAGVLHVWLQLQRQKHQKSLPWKECWKVWASDILDMERFWWCSFQYFQLYSPTVYQ